MGGFLEEQRSKLRPARWVVVSTTRRLEEELSRKTGQHGQGPREEEEHKLERNEKDEGWWCHEMGPERSEVKSPRIPSPGLKHGAPGYSQSVHSVILFP